MLFHYLKVGFRNILKYKVFSFINVFGLAAAMSVCMLIMLMLAVTIACLGMLGMATYTTERRRKEVGIRKVLGAYNMSNVLLLSREFLVILAIAITPNINIKAKLRNYKGSASGSGRIAIEAVRSTANSPWATCKKPWRLCSKNEILQHGFLQTKGKRRYLLNLPPGRFRVRLLHRPPNRDRDYHP